MKINGEIYDKTAASLKALGHPTRLEILSILATVKGPGLSVKNIQEKLKVGQPETSKHLIVMRKNKILLMKKRDGFSLYRINRELNYLQSLIKFLNLL